MTCFFYYKVMLVSFLTFSQTFSHVFVHVRYFIRDYYKRWDWAHSGADSSASAFRDYIFSKKFTRKTGFIVVVFVYVASSLSKQRIVATQYQRFTETRGGNLIVPPLLVATKH